MSDLLTTLAPAPEVIELVIPGVPVAKGRARFRHIKTKGGKEFTSTYTPAKTRDYENLVKMAASDAMMGRPPFAYPIELEVLLYLPVPASWSARKQSAALCGAIAHTKKPDADNCLKAIKDGLNKIAWEDDSQVMRVSIFKGYSSAPRAIVRIKRGPGERAP